MNLENIRRMVAEDVIIDDTQLDAESLKLPQLHNKYLNFLLDAKLTLERKQNGYYRLRKHKWEYYTGKMDEVTLARLEWKPFDLKILRQDIGMYMESDDDLITLLEQIRYYKEVCEYLDAIIKEITYRHNKIRNAIDWKKFLAGN